jgi:NADH-ubiquinone oxidoreductase chain 5
MFYNKYVTDLVLKLGRQTTKVIDKGSIELIGPFGLEKGLPNLSKNLYKLDTGVITSYALYILVGLTFYIILPFFYVIDKGLLNLSKNLSKLDTGVITSYALYILVGLTFYIILPFFCVIDNNLLLIVMFGVLSIILKNIFNLNICPKSHSFSRLVLKSAIRFGMPTDIPDAIFFFLLYWV